MWFLAVLPLAALFSAQADAGPSAASARALYVQPLGGCARQTPGVAEVVAALRAFYPIEVRVLACQELPRAAFYPPRKRYRAERLLAYLNQRMPKDGWRILGLTDVDISTTKGRYPDWGVMGLGELPGTATVISSFRCRKKARSAAHAIERLAKVAVHEIGHTLGLPHCPTRGCLMEDAMGKVVTTDRERDFCPRCRALARQQGFRITENPKAAWLQKR
ncbi:MAG: matrixin family metalloprotease [Deltaproteobacteria bacterium]|nr:matrixin family metalloprotease [Deltaproteobacteria bacterium]